jgi:hypothetical protein
VEKNMSEQKSKIFLAIILAIVSVLLISAVSYTFPVRATIPLNVEFVVGEKMVYDTTTSKISQTNNNADNSSSSSLTGESVDSTKDILEVLDFDGQSYILNHTVTTSNASSTLTSFQQKIDKIGISTYFVEIGNQSVNISNAGSYAYVSNVIEKLTDKPQVRVGDTWRIPYETRSGVETSGDLIVTFYGFENLTVPAGTYNVFRVGIKSENLNYHYTSSNNGFNANVAENFNVQMYLEYGSLRQIKWTMQDSISAEAPMNELSGNYLTEMVLVDHIIP